MRIQENIPLAPLTTFHIGGPARFFVRVQSVDELREALDVAGGRMLKVFILGGGSNILVDDAGFNGLVVKIEIRGVEEKDGLLIAGAGENWDGLVQYAVEKNLWGIENLSGIPGTVGAAPIQNIGAYGVELKDVVMWVEVFDTESNSLVRIQNRECGFGYRSSNFKKSPGRHIVTRVCLKLQRDGTPNLSYHDLQKLDLRSPTLGEVRGAVLAIRAGKFPSLVEEGTAGSFFLNPIVSEAKARELAQKFPELPCFVVPGGIKISLAWLLDHSLHAKGMRVGGARCFERQPLVIAARKNTRAREVRALANRISELVQKNFDITLEPEVKIL